MYVQLQHTAEGIMADKVDRLSAQRRSRFGFPEIEEMRKRSLDELEGLAGSLR
jgi:zinc protease